MESFEADSVAAYIAIDWADQKHEIRMLVVETGKTESCQLKQEPEALIDWVQNLQKRFQGQKMAVVIEQRKGALIYALMTYDFLILYPINPKTLAKFREAFYPSGSKSDPRDAELLLELVSQHRGKLRRWIPDKAETRLLQLLVETRRGFVDDVTRLTNKLMVTLKEYFPQALDWAGELKSKQAIDFLTKWPTLDSLKRAKSATIDKFYQEHGLRNRTRIDERLKAIADAKNLTDDYAVVTASKTKAQTIVAQLKVLVSSIAEYDRQIAEIYDKHPDSKIFSSFPCAKQVLGPRLLAAFGQDRKRFASALEIQSFSGIAPVTMSSGQSRVVQKRKACPHFLRQTFHEYAGQSIKKAGWARTYYRTLRDRNVKHHAAVRSLAYKWMRIMYTCWQEQEPYSEEKYVTSLEKRKSPLAASLRRQAAKSAVFGSDA